MTTTTKLHKCEDCGYLNEDCTPEYLYTTTSGYLKEHWICPDCLKQRGIESGAAVQVLRLKDVMELIEEYACNQDDIDLRKTAEAIIRRSRQGM